MNPDTTPTPRTDSEWSSTSNGLRLHELCKQLERELTEKTNENAMLRELFERLCDSVAENWDEGIANYFREEASKLNK